MMSPRNLAADTSPLKRSFGEAVGHDPFPYLYHLEQNGRRASTVKVAGVGRCHTAPSPTKRRSISIHRSSTMPLQSGAAVSAAFPSFMSVFGSGMPASDENHDIYARPEAKEAAVNTLPSGDYGTQTGGFVGPLLQHRQSVTSLTSDSTNSSPTTTSSTFDSPLIADASPSSSPESPSSALPLAPFKPAKPSGEPVTEREGRMDAVPQSPDSSSRADSPRGRNVKNLSLKTAASTANRPTTASSAETAHTFATPLSPLKEPPRTGRRKPTNLTIQTPGPEQTTFVQPLSPMPPTPSNRPSLHHFQSSPALPSLISPVMGPPGGLHLPIPNLTRGGSRPISQSSSVLSLASSLHDLKEEENHHQPQKSQETQERGYPNGPVKIYDDGLYLYLEPTLDEANNFDTVINVAKEIKNPFEGISTQDIRTPSSVWDHAIDRSSIPEPQTAVSVLSFKSAFEWPQWSDAGTPTTPKASSNPPHGPEYIHVPWDHNSEIVEDLFPLCKIIDDRIAAQKRVLVHCQLGVSRSASLVIAYGIYKGYKPDFHTMYEAVKERSQWVGPNMSLIYQLMDFRSKVEKSGYATTFKEPRSEWFKSSNEHVQTPKPGAIARVNTAPDLTQKFVPAPPTNAWRNSQPPPINLNKKLPPVPLFPKDDPPPPQPSTGFATVENRRPMAAPVPFSSFHMPPPVLPPVPPKRASPQPAPRPLPLRELSQNLTEIPPHRPRHIQLPRIPMNPQPTQMDLAMHDVPQTPSLFSPRATEFMASPFGRTAAGDLHAGSRASLLLSTMPGAFPIFVDVSRDKSEPIEVDPRSPPQPGDPGEIVRSIDDYL